MECDVRKNPKNTGSGGDFSGPQVGYIGGLQTPR
jgi:hypothetical protein